MLMNALYFGIAFYKSMWLGANDSDRISVNFKFT
jgi:hypothetical protein